MKFITVYMLYILKFSICFYLFELLYTQMVKKGPSRKEVQRRKGGAKKATTGGGGKARVIPNRLRILEDLRAALSHHGLCLGKAMYVCDMSNQKWFPKWFKQHAAQHKMRCEAVISSHGLFLQPNIPELLTNKSRVVHVVGDGCDEKGELPGVHEDPRIATILTKSKEAVVLVSGDGNMDPTKSHIYNAVCIRIQQGLKTIVLASHDSIHENLRILCGMFSGLVEIVIAHP